jgi:hypothetical protein
MWPLSYTGLKIIYDQQIQEALEHHSFSAGSETPKRGLLRTCDTFLARFAHFSVQKPKATSLFCNWEEAGTVSCAATSMPRLV